MACSRGCCPDQLSHYRSISISADALPTKGAPISAIKAKESRWDRDGEAYKRLRKEGLQPAGIDGCALTETMATHPLEVEKQRPVHPQEIDVKQFANALADDLQAQGLAQ